MPLHRFVLSIAAVSSLLACTANELNTDVGALRVNADTRSKTEIENVLSSALDGVPVNIADDALTRESTLIIERGMRRSIDRPAELGRELGRPNHFQLVLDGGQCFLIHRETGLRWMLATTECVAE